MDMWICDGGDDGTKCVRRCTQTVTLYSQRPRTAGEPMAFGEHSQSGVELLHGKVEVLHWEGSHLPIEVLQWEDSPLPVEVLHWEGSHLPVEVLQWEGSHPTAEALYRGDTLSGREVEAGCWNRKQRYCPGFAAQPQTRTSRLSSSPLVTDRTLGQCFVQSPC